MSGFLRWFCPDKYVESVQAIGIDELKSLGIGALLVDLDNTLVPWRGYDITPAVLGWLKEVEAAGIKVCIVSNSRNPRRLNRLSEAFGLPYARRVMKPRRGGFREALEILGVEPKHAVVIGDQVITDVLGGKRFGVYTILVTPLSKREFVGTKVSRFFERILLRLLAERGMLRSKDIESNNSVEHSDEMSSQMKTEC